MNKMNWKIMKCDDSSSSNTHDFSGVNSICWHWEEQRGWENRKEQGSQRGKEREGKKERKRLWKERLWEKRYTAFVVECVYCV